MTNFKGLGIISILFLFLVSINAASVINENGEFKVEIDKQSSQVFSNNIHSEFEFVIVNNLDESQSFDLMIDKQSGWDIISNEDKFVLNSNEAKTIKLDFKSNSAFDYTANVVSPDFIKIAQNDEYSGFFEFPVNIVGNENVTVTYSVNIKPTKDNLKFSSKIQKTDVSPVLPLKFTVSSEAISKDQDVEISIRLGDYEFDKILDDFSFESPYKIYQVNVPNSVNPGKYPTKVTVRILKDGGESAQEWYSNEQLDVVSYNNVVVGEVEGRGLFKDKVEITVTNNGNVDDVFVRELEFGFFKGLLFGTSVEKYEDLDNGAKFSISLKKGETKSFSYSFNYLALMISVLVVVFLVVYIWYRSNSNPLTVSTQLYEVKRVKHEGVKSVKVRVGFENIRETEIDKLKIVFRMPSYLQVKDNSFSLTEPKNVLKGETQYKLVWDFTRFEKGDTRLLGFDLVNLRGILGDVRIPDLEIEVKVHGKTKKYYQSFPVIKG